MRIASKAATYEFLKPVGDALLSAFDVHTNIVAVGPDLHDSLTHRLDEHILLERHTRMLVFDETSLSTPIEF